MQKIIHAAAVVVMAAAITLSPTSRPALSSEPDIGHGGVPAVRFDEDGLGVGVGDGEFNPFIEELLSDESIPVTDQDVEEEPAPLASGSSRLQATVPARRTPLFSTPLFPTGYRAAGNASGNDARQFHLFSNPWVRFEHVLLWTDADDTPPLLTTSPSGTLQEQAGRLDRTDTTVLYGEDSADIGVRNGNRLSVGTWLDSDKVFALEASWLWQYNATNRRRFGNISSDRPILARPFHNLATNQQDVQLAAFPDVVAGQVVVDRSSDLDSLGFSLRGNLLSTRRYRFEFLAGYRYFRYRERMTLQENLVMRDPGGFLQQGTTFDVRDQFATSNKFHGGELGLAYEITRDRWALELLGKVALGNVRQDLAIAGRTIVRTPGDPSEKQPGGLLALPTNIGNHRQDALMALPELSCNLRIKATPRVSLVVGYSVGYLSDVLRAGEQVDPRINPTQVGGNQLVGLAYPAPPMAAGSLWTQAVNLGVDARW